MLIVTIVVTVQRTIAKKASRNPGFEKRFLGKLSAVVKDGVLQPAEMGKPLISRDRILPILRSESIVHLGQVKRLYLEENGAFSLVKAEEPRPLLKLNLKKHNIMKSAKQPQQQAQQEEDFRNEGRNQDIGGATEEAAVDDDGAPVLDEQDLEENNLTEEQADNIEWENDQSRGNQG